ncbi:hypothetical protein ABT160_00875 [Streptomyces sp. NPDC001941]|uniref:hypothetical protein n=1 Tax=Streptomyces sp. NPDC001941 TaxID=3154659 RepID=UPI0033170EDD
MRTTARLLTGTALSATALGAFLAPVAYAGDYDALEVYPSSAAPGTTVTVNTTACGSNGHGVGDARALGAGDFQLASSTHKEVVVGQFTIPHGAAPGRYEIAVACDNGKTASGSLTVEQGGGPHGHVKTGIGGSVGPDTTQIAVGAAVLAAAAVGGTWVLRRRASGAQGS